MIDNGAAVNIIKIGALHSDVLVDTDQAVPLTGISDHSIDTYGTATLHLRDRPVTFVVVKDEFPIGQDGILGRDYLKREQAVISYHYNALMISGDVMHPLPFIDPHSGESIGEVSVTKDAGRLRELDVGDVRDDSPASPVKVMYTIPRRTRQVVRINIINQSQKEGYLPRIDLGYDDVYLGEGIVKVQEDGGCYVMAINTREEDVSFEVDAKELIPFEYASLDFEPGAEEDIPVAANNPIVDKETRVSCLKDLIDVKHLNEEEKAHINRLLEDFPDVFLLPGDPLPCTNAVEHYIPLENNMPVNAKQYRHPVMHKEFIEKDIQGKLRDGIIAPSSSPSNSPIWIVPKKPDSQGNPRWRMVVDFRDLNQRTVGDAYPLPNITDILDQLGGAMYFSVFDLASGFHQIRMAPEDQWKTAFSTPGGHYEYKRMPMGLKNAPATFQRLMDQIKRGLDCKETLVYMDDVIIHANTLTEHDKRVRQFFSRLTQTNLVLQPDKVHFLRKEVAF